MQAQGAQQPRLQLQPGQMVMLPGGTKLQVVATSHDRNTLGLPSFPVLAQSIDYYVKQIPWYLLVIAAIYGTWRFLKA